MPESRRPSRPRRKPRHRCCTSGSQQLHLFRTSRSHHHTVTALVGMAATIFRNFRASLGLRRASITPSSLHHVRTNLHDSQNHRAFRLRPLSLLRLNSPPCRPAASICHCSTSHRDHHLFFSSLSRYCRAYKETNTIANLHMSFDLH